MLRSRTHQCITTVILRRSRRIFSCFLRCGSGQESEFPARRLSGKFFQDWLESLGMNPRELWRRIHILSMCCAFLSTGTTHLCFGAEKTNAISRDEVDRSVIAALSLPHNAKPKVISHVDLTGPFATVTQWTFVVVQESGQTLSQIEEDHGPIHLCLVQGGMPDCSERLYQHADSGQPWFATPYHLLAGNVVYSNGKESDPLLLVKVCGAEGPNGNCGIATAFYRYDSRSDHFLRVFLNLTGQ